MGTQHRHRPGVAGRQHLRKAPKTPKLFMPNLHTAYVLNNSYSKKVKLCSRCRRMLKKQGKIKVWKKEEKTPVRPTGGPEQKIIKQTVKTTKEKPLVKTEKKTEKKIEEKPVKKIRKPKTIKIPTVSVEELVGKK